MEEEQLEGPWRLMILCDAESCEPFYFREPSGNEPAAWGVLSV